MNLLKNGNNILTCFRLNVNTLKQVRVEYLQNILGGGAMYPRIRDLREDADLSQTKLAQKLGMSQTGYSKYETGENDIPTAILIRLSDLYNVSIDYMLGVSDCKARK